MVVNTLSFKSTGYFSELICDYLNENEALKPFYNHFPNLENFKLQIQEKQAAFNASKRAVLVKALIHQYTKTEASKSTLNNIESLLQANTFTVTTGHQLNLFTGPLYFIYKIITTINLSEKLTEVYPDYNFVPIYWMATEDHDFEEINHFKFKNETIQWLKEASGAVGNLKTTGLEKVSELFKAHLGVGNKAKYLINLFKEAYLEHDNLSDATLYLANQLFKEYGLVIIDANTPQLKKMFSPYVKDELLNTTAEHSVLRTSELLQQISKSYNIQVNPRKINLFYLKENIRERIVFEDNEYKVLNTEITFTKESILKELQNYPERFSPNVIMRPLYQEVILPNLCYIGGGGELAYWFQLKSLFSAQKITFPIVLLRNSVLILTKKESDKLKKLNLTIKDLFSEQNNLIDKKVKEISKISIDFSEQKQHLNSQFKNLYRLAKQTDASFLGAVKAQERKQIKGLEHLEKRLLKAQKRKLSEELERIKTIQNQLFPNKSLQERQANYSTFYLEYGSQLIDVLKQKLNPLEQEFTVLTI